MTRLLVKLSLILFAHILCVRCSSQEETIKNDDLNVKGNILKTQKGEKYYAFYGIPYAKPPLGEKRFKNPEPIDKKFTETYDATKYGNICPQYIPSPVVFENDSLTMSEDCLNLNIYTKSFDGKRPVIFYIHGGGYFFGASSIHNPKYLLDEDIVFVSINYRLGAFGFLSMGTKEAPGNIGFKDQNLALKWVHDNIHHFGGDKDSVTLMGHSAGAMSTILHMVSPMSKNLFHKIIAMSGSATHHWESDNTYWTKSLTKLVNCENNDDSKVLDCLRGKSWKEIIDASQTWLSNGLVKLIWNYEIEKDFGQERFLTDNPSKLFEKGDFHHVPIISSLTKDEFADMGHYVVKNPELKKEFNDNFNKMASEQFGYYFSKDKSEKISKNLKEFYFNDKPIDDTKETQLANLFSDSLINHGVHRLVDLASKHVDVYYTMLKYKGRFSCSLYSDKDMPLYVHHGDILFYVFVYDKCAPEFAKTDPEYKVMQQHVKYFTNFAKNGNPNKDTKLDEIDCVEWKKCKKDEISTLYIDNICKMGTPPYKERLEFWDNMFKVE